MASIKEIQEEIIDEFEFYDDWNEKYAYIIESGKALPEMPSDLKKDDNKIKGCQSQVWLSPEFRGGKIFFHADSDALIVKGLIALLIRVYSGQEPEDILINDPEFIEAIGMRQHLSPTRSNGLSQMVKQIKFYALGYKQKTQ